MSTGGYREIDADDYRVLHPRPAYLVVARKPDGGLNVMAAAWVMPVSEEPPMVVLSLDSESYTSELLSENGELTINVVGEEHLEMVWGAGSVSGRSVDKWSKLGLKPLPSKVIGVPGVKGAYGVLECVVKEKKSVGECVLFICEVKAARVREDLYTRYGWDLRKARILLHCGRRAFTVPGKLLVAGGKRG